MARSTLLTLPSDVIRYCVAKDFLDIRSQRALRITCKQLLRILPSRPDTSPSMKDFLEFIRVPFLRSDIRPRKKYKNHYRVCWMCLNRFPVRKLTWLEDGCTTFYDKSGLFSFYEPLQWDTLPLDVAMFCEDCDSAEDDSPVHQCMMYIITKAEISRNLRFNRLKLVPPEKKRVVVSSWKLLGSEDMRRIACIRAKQNLLKSNPTLDSADKPLHWPTKDEVKQILKKKRILVR